MTQGSAVPCTVKTFKPLHGFGTLVLESGGGVALLGSMQSGSILGFISLTEVDRHVRIGRIG